MNTNAVYTVYENGKRFYFHSRYAGGFGYPFEAAGYLSSLKYALSGSRFSYQKICAAPLLTQMKGTCLFPDYLKDKLLFQKITRDKAMSEEVERNTPFYITLNLNQDTVAFHFNRRFEEFSSLEDIAFPCFEPDNPYSGGRFMEELLARQGEQEETVAEAGERIFRELILRAAAELGQPEQEAVGTYS